MNRFILQIKAVITQYLEFCHVVLLSVTTFSLALFTSFALFIAFIFGVNFTDINIRIQHYWQTLKAPKNMKLSHYWSDVLTAAYNVKSSCILSCLESLWLFCYYCKWQGTVRLRVCACCTTLRAKKLCAANCISNDQQYNVFNCTSKTAGYKTRIK